MITQNQTTADKEAITATTAAETAEKTATTVTLFEPAVSMFSTGADTLLEGSNALAAFDFDKFDKMPEAFSILDATLSDLPSQFEAGLSRILSPLPDLIAAAILRSWVPWRSRGTERQQSPTIQVNLDSREIARGVNEVNAEFEQSGGIL